MDKHANNTAQVAPLDKKNRGYSYLIKSIIIFFILFAAEESLFLVLQYIDDLHFQFEWVVDKLEYVQQFIINFMSAANNIALTVLVILFTYFIKAYLPFLPLSILCMMSGIVFGKYWWVALIINMIGLAGMFYFRFNSGRVKGENYMQNLLRKNKYVRLALDANGASSYSLLAAFRFFPCFPINFVSRLYGSNKDCKFHWYMLISLAAIAPRVYVYTRIGKEIFNPFSRSFVILIMIFIAFSGLGAFIANTVFFIKRKQEDKSQPSGDAPPAPEVLQEQEQKERYIPIRPEE